MPLITSVSGIRGTIGGAPGHNLTPPDIVAFTAAFASRLAERHPQRRIVIGRDARLSGPMLVNLVQGTLMGLGVEVIDLGLTTTPTVELAVTHFKAAGGMILTASHNPMEWNALKLLNADGEFLSADDGADVLARVKAAEYHFATVLELGSVQTADFLQAHIDHVLALPLVQKEAIAQANLRIGVDAVNSSGGIYVPALLKALGVAEANIFCIHCEPNGRFAHNPEPLPEHLGDLCALVRENQLDLGIVVDPDVDRLAFVMENGELFGEEYTLVAAADYVLRHTPGPVVSNLSSSRALRDLAHRYGVAYHAAPVGEAHVVEVMKREGAVLGGEGNGGVIYPASHYGRDALVGIGLLLSHFATQKRPLTALRAELPQYFMFKHKINLAPDVDTHALLNQLAEAHPEANRIDGVKVDLEHGWAHVRRSNTEPIVRIYTEAPSTEHAQKLALQFEQKLLSLL